MPLALVRGFFMLIKKVVKSKFFLYIIIYMCRNMFRNLLSLHKRFKGVVFFSYTFPPLPLNIIKNG